MAWATTDGDDRSLGPAARSQSPVLRAEVGVPAAGGGLGGFDKDLADPAAALPSGRSASAATSYPSSASSSSSSSSNSARSAGPSGGFAAGPTEPRAAAAALTTLVASVSLLLAG